MRAAEPGFGATEFEFNAEFAARTKVDVGLCVIGARLEVADEFDVAAGAFDFAEDLVVGDTRSGMVAIGTQGHAVG